MTPLPRVIGITPGDHGSVRDILCLVEAAVQGGLRALILREPHLDTRAYVTLARRLDPLFAALPGPGLVLHGKHPGALDIARESGWGLHLPAGADLAAARHAVSGPLGASCHTALELGAARAARCDYALLSPIWAPRSKPEDARAPLGAKELQRLCRSAGLPVFALGGIEPRRVRPCLDAGACGVAALGALFPPGATPEEVEALSRALHSAADRGLGAAASREPG